MSRKVTMNQHESPSEDLPKPIRPIIKETIAKPINASVMPLLGLFDRI